MEPNLLKSIESKSDASVSLTDNGPDVELRPPLKLASGIG